MASRRISGLSPLTVPGRYRCVGTQTTSMRESPKPLMMNFQDEPIPDRRKNLNNNGSGEFETIRWLEGMRLARYLGNLETRDRSFSNGFILGTVLQRSFGSSGKLQRGYSTHCRVNNMKLIVSWSRSYGFTFTN